ncbi:hypothetical protein Tdes44962_MAKER01455 [Teratosphaeria destructans]|uniref:Uncharacterized protein n=1 Tax=Teratosphaeria destructans TaxID=418781 RepID=A0A9W7SZ01_9PEZI|nr:hypothetical protein Tdes44962_MAKER01455 [Teratosphaeria destructans]
MAQQESPSSPHTKVYARASRPSANDAPRQSSTQHQNQTWQARLFPRNFPGQYQVEGKDLPRPNQPSKPVGTPDALPMTHIEVPNAATFTLPHFFSRDSEMVFNSVAKGTWERKRQDCFSESESQLQRSNGKASSNMPLNKFLEAILPLVEPIMNSTQPDERKELDCIVEVRNWAKNHPGDVPTGDAETAKVALETEQYEWLKAAQREAAASASSDSRPFTSSIASDKTIMRRSVRQTVRHGPQHLSGQGSPSPGRRGSTTARGGGGYQQQQASPPHLDQSQRQAPENHARQQSNALSPIRTTRMPYEQHYTFSQQPDLQQLPSPPMATEMSYYSNPYQAMASSPQHTYSMYDSTTHYQPGLPTPLQYLAPFEYQQPMPSEIPRPRNLPTAVWTFLNAVNPMVASIRNPRDREEMVTQWAYGHMVQVPMISSQVLDLSDDEQRLLWAAQTVLPAESKMHLFGAQEMWRQG